MVQDTFRTIEITFSYKKTVKKLSNEDIITLQPHNHKTIFIQDGLIFSKDLKKKIFL